MGFFNRNKSKKLDAKEFFETVLTPEERELYREYQEKGDDKAKLQLITEAQGRYIKKQEESTGVDIKNIIVELGKDTSMANVINQTMRVLEFDRNGAVIDGDNVKAKSLFKPYGYLIVESPIFNNKARLPIIHKTDFLLADLIFADPKAVAFVNSDEFLVTYSPKEVIGNGLSGSPHHVLHFALAPRGTLDLYYSMGNDMHFSKPNPEMIFGPFIYDGEVKIGASEFANNIKAIIRSGPNMDAGRYRAAGLELLEVENIFAIKDDNIELLEKTINQVTLIGTMIAEAEAQGKDINDLNVLKELGRKILENK